MTHDNRHDSDHSGGQESGIDLVHRIAIAGGLRSLASLIERRMDLPVPRHVEIHHAVIGESDDAERREVDRIAAILGETPRYGSDRQHYTVTRQFGPVTYTATAITEQDMARYQAETEAARRRRNQAKGEER